MTQVQGSAAVDGGRVELIIGDLFESDAHLLVAPCSVKGNMSAEVRNQVTRLGAAVPTGPFTPGQVIAAPTRNTTSGVTVLFALVARSGSGDRDADVSLVRKAASRIGAFASGAGTVAAFPLLAAGAGELPPEQSMRAIIAGFQETAHSAAILRIHVLHDRLVDLLRPLLPVAAKHEPPADSGDQPEAAARYSDRLNETIQRLAHGNPVSAGALAATAMAIDLDGGKPKRPPEWEALADAGPVRPVDDHLETVRLRWSPDRVPTLDSAHLLLGLALDDGVGWPLLRSGVVDALVAGWQAERDSPAWDCLSQDGRGLAEDQPLLATALGAPAEWSASLPAPATLLAFSPGGDRVAALAGHTVYETGADDRTRRVGEVDGTVVSLGWGRSGVLALRIGDSIAEIIRVDTGRVVGSVPTATDGILSGGLPAWLQGPSGIIRWWGPDQPAHDETMSSAGSVLAVDGTGRRGLVGIGDEAVLLSTLTEDQPAIVDSAPSSASPQPVATIGRIPWPEGPYALVALGKLAAVAEVTDDDLLVISEPGRPPIAHVPTGGLPIDALATDLHGHCLATATADQVSVWPVARSRPVSRGIAGYDPDSVCGGDLLDADRDAMAIASLIASARLHPPLAVGLFGDWGSGKTFVLDRIVAMLEDLALSNDEGYVDNITIVSFNAWHYAETNLWASLVDQVLRKVAPPGHRRNPRGQRGTAPCRRRGQGGEAHRR